MLKINIIYLLHLYICMYTNSILKIKDRDKIKKEKRPVCDEKFGDWFIERKEKEKEEGKTNA